VDDLYPNIIQNFCTLCSCQWANDVLTPEPKLFVMDMFKRTLFCVLYTYGVLRSSYPDLLPDVFCLTVRIFLLILVLLYIYINSTNIPPIMIINRIYETENLLSLQLVSFLVGLRIYQHPCILFDGENISFDSSLVLYI